MAEECDSGEMDMGWAKRLPRVRETRAQHNP